MRGLFICIHSDRWKGGEEEGANQNVHKHVEVVCEPESLEADSSEVEGGEHVHKGKDEEKQNACHA